jgi:DNA repair protein RadC
MEADTSKLSDIELVAAVLRKPIERAAGIVRDSGGVRGVLNKPADNTTENERGILEAVKELGKRYLREAMLGANFVRSPQAVSDYLTAALRDEKREIFKVLFLDKGLRIIAEKDLFFGTIDEAAVHPREIVKAALLADASSIVLVHNHPSGKVEPSREDYEITQKIKAACATVSVRVLDHIIIGENQYFSFSERSSL